MNAVLRDKAGYQRLIAGISVDEQGPGRDRPGKTGRQIVERNDALAGIDERIHHMAADIARAACDQNRHVGVRFSACSIESLGSASTARWRTEGANPYR